MKLIATLLDTARPLFGKNARLHRLHPVFAAADNLFFASSDKLDSAPFVRDPIELKRYMSMVIIALLPAFAASLYFFGWRVLLMLLVSYAAGGAVEVLFAVIRKEEIAEGFLVTGFIFPLILPPATPLWMVALGIVFGVVVGKEVFGGTGRNLFNAALLGRCFLSFSYPAALAGAWMEPGRGWFGALTRGFWLSPDAITGATPLAAANSGELATPLLTFLGQTAGSTGETSAVAIILGGVFLLMVGIISWRTVAGILGSFMLVGTALQLFGPATISPVWFHLSTGGILFGAFFMATDPVTSPVTQGGKLLYGILIGAVTMLIRCFSGYVEGVTFAILLGNICAPLLDEAVIQLRIRRYARA